MNSSAMNKPDSACLGKPLPDDADLGTVVSLAEETADISAREIVTGRVRVTTRTDTVDQLIGEELYGTRVDVTRVPIGRTLDPAAFPEGPRTEGEVTIIPIFEEIVVVEKRIVLKEELHITRLRTIDKVEIPIDLRKQRGIVERLDPLDTPVGRDNTPGT